MRGDPPLFLDYMRKHNMSTPHARGSTLKYLRTRGQADVYPACAGIHLIDNGYRGELFSLPRMRGDPPAPLGR